MESHTQLFIIVFATVLMTRLWLFLKPISSPRFQNFKLHHYMYGLVLVGISIIFSSLVIYAIGLGLILDELPLFIRYKNNDFHWKEYNSNYSRIGAIVCLALLFIFRNYIPFVN